MMRVVNANLFSKFFKTAVFVIALASVNATVHAAPVTQTVVENGPGFGNANVSHISSDNESLLFEVKVDNNTGERFSVIVKDEYSHTIYRGWFTGKEFNKKFRLPKTDSEKLTFIIKSESGNASESFEVNSSRRIIEDVVVKKVG